MICAQSRVVGEYLRVLSTVERSSDADILRRHRAGDREAFAAIVHRHGPMVYGVCRRVLGRSADADDAFQATFLALVRRPGAIRDPNALSAWLHRVALRTARKALARRRPVRPATDSAMSRDPSPADQAAWADVRRALDEELDRLPARYRAPLVLCYLDGATRDEAASRLRLSVATLDRRLAGGRALLRARLTRLGLAAVALGSAIFADGLDAAVPDELARRTADLSTCCDSASAAVQALAAGGATVRASIIATVVLAAGLTATFIGASGRPGADEPPPKSPPPVASKPAEDDPADRLPDGAIARIGSTRFRHAGLSDLAFIDGGKTVVTLGAEPNVRYWDPQSGRQSRPAVTLKGMDGRLALSFDGTMAASCSRDKVTVRNIATGKELASFAGPKQDTVSFGFSPDGRMLCAATWDCQLVVYNWKAAKEQRVPIPPRPFGCDSTFHGSFSPDGKHFAGAGGSGQPLCVFDTTTWREEHRFLCNAATSTFSPDSKRLVVCSMNNDAGGREAVIRVFDVGTGKEVAQHPLGFDGAYFSLVVSPDGRFLGCGCSERGSLLDLKTGKVAHKLTGRPWGLGFSPDGKTFAATEAGTHLRLWDVATGQERHGQPGNVSGVVATAASPDGRLIATAEWVDRSVSVWDATAGKRIRLLPLKEENHYTRDLAFSPDGRTLAAGLHEGTALIWEIATGKEVRMARLGDSPVDGPGRSTGFHSVRVLPDGRHAATVDQDVNQRSGTRVIIWDLARGKASKQWTYLGEPRGRAWSADGQTLALEIGQRVALIDLETGAERAVLDGAERDSAPPVMSPDGRLVAARQKFMKGQTSTVGVYEVATGKLLNSLTVGWGEFTLGADNRTLFVADQTHLRAWDIATGKEVSNRALKAPGGDQLAATAVIALAGRRVFTPLADGTGLIWDVSTASQPQTAPIDEKQLATCWTDLLSDKPATAYATVWRMCDAEPGAVAAFLRRHLRQEERPDPAKLRKLIADLNSQEFRTREKATKELQDLGHAAAPALRKALSEKPAPEAAERIEHLLARKPDVGSRPELLRRLRALQVLERIDSKDARDVLSDLAGGLSLAPETKEAQAALGRLGR